MYSIVLVMALSGGAEVPAAHRCNCACSCACYGCNCACSCACSGRGHRHHNRCHCNCYGCACHGYVSCCGCCGPVVTCCGPVVTCAGCTGHPVSPPPQPGKKKDMPKPGKTGGTEGVAAPATIVVNLPADAQLKVDDYATASTSGTRVFVTPALEAGKEFSYTLSAEIVRDGKKVTTTKQVTVRAGEETRATLEFPTAAVAQK
ncbi:MAG TPA: TIGR03000 domain-containing protein [Gemmataceae bacterium]|nr:TIGR03000 domain-containing protein [Gemmataceae bacterium]